MKKRNTKHYFKNVYSDEQESKIQLEFERLEGEHYLEHAGATLYSEAQISDSYNDFKKTLYANPHARSISSNLTDDAIDEIRFQILEYFNTNLDEYSVIFTSGATQALKIIAESFHYKDGVFSYLEDNHTSVLGMREYAPNIVAIGVDDINTILNAEKYLSQEKAHSNSLFVYPAESNFSGYKYPLTWIHKIHEGALNSATGNKLSNWFCVLDAACYVSTNHLDLSLYKPDFIPVSFYKIFGFPTGIGALLVRNASAHALQKIYFGGGTVYLALSSENKVVRRKVLHENFEDGSLNFLSILGLKHGFNTLMRLSLSMELISNHTFNLGQYLYQNLVSLRHDNSNPVAIVYTQSDFKDINYQGGIVNFNLLRKNGDYIGYAEVLNFANLNGIHLRTGCFCNPGACKYHLKLTLKDIEHHFKQGHVCGDSNDLIDGVPTGSVRASFGYMSKKEDVDALLKMIEKCFVSKPISEKQTITIQNGKLNEGTINSPLNVKTDDHQIRSQTISEDYMVGSLESVFIYPVKSCGHFRIIQDWEISSTGLKFDRKWMIVNRNGVCITQKKCANLCLIKPIIHLQNNLLELTCERFGSTYVPLELKANETTGIIQLCSSKVCGDKISGLDCGDKVGKWLSDVLNMDGLRLLRQHEDTEKKRISKSNKSVNLSLSNQSQFLMINLASVQWLLQKIPDEDFDEDIERLVHRFRPNFVVRFAEPFIENSFKMVTVGSNEFQFDGNCTRCEMICIDQTTGEKNIEPLRTLSKEFAGKINFGVYLKVMKSDRQMLHTNTSIVGFHR